VRGSVMPCGVPGACNELVVAWPMITLPVLTNLTQGRSYRIQVQLTADSVNLFHVHFRVRGI
jgi:hypothetical protein